MSKNVEKNFQYDMINIGKVVDNMCTLKKVNNLSTMGGA